MSYWLEIWALWKHIKMDRLINCQADRIHTPVTNYNSKSLHVNFHCLQIGKTVT